MRRGRVFGRGQSWAAAFRTFSLRWRQRRAAGELHVTPDSVRALAWIIFPSTPRITGANREKQVLPSGPPTAGRIQLLLLVLFFGFLQGPKLLFLKDNTRKRRQKLFIKVEV